MEAKWEATYTTTSERYAYVRGISGYTWQCRCVDASMRRRVDASTDRRVDAKTCRRVDPLTRRCVNTSTRRDVDASTRRRVDADPSASGRSPTSACNYCRELEILKLNLFVADLSGSQVLSTFSNIELDNGLNLNDFFQDFLGHVTVILKS